MAYKFESDYVAPINSIRLKNDVRGPWSILMQNNGREIEDTPFPHGLWIPLSSTFEDLRPGSEVENSQVHEVTSSLLGSFGDTRIALRGSTWMFQLLHQSGGAEKRGTISTAIRMGFRGGLKKFSHTKSAQALGELENASDIDLVLSEVKGEDFNAVSSNVLDRMRDVIKAKAYDESHNFEYENGVVGGNIPYDQVTICRKDGGKFLTVFWTPGKINRDTTFDTRLDQSYALSWDWASVGEVSLGLPEEIKNVLPLSKEKRDSGEMPDQKRMAHHQGVYPHADFVNGEDEVWFHLPSANVKVLGEPIKLGEKFQELPVVEQFRLALRCVQKATLAEENITLTENGLLARAARYPRSGGIDAWETIPKLRNIDIDAFRDSYQQMSEAERMQLQNEVMKEMMMMFFYPARAIDYGTDTGIFRFFPQLKDITYQEWGEVADLLPAHEIYVRKQYMATHSDEPTSFELKQRRVLRSSLGGFISVKDWDRQQEEIQRRRNAKTLQDPYQQLFDTLAVVAPEKIPDVDNPYEMLDVLFNLDEVPFEQKGIRNSVIEKIDDIKKHNSVDPEVIERVRRDLIQKDAILRRKSLIANATAIAVEAAGLTAQHMTENAWYSLAGAVLGLGVAIPLHIHFKREKERENEARYIEVAGSFPVENVEVLLGADERRRG